MLHVKGVRAGKTDHIERRRKIFERVTVLKSATQSKCLVTPNLIVLCLYSKVNRPRMQINMSTLPLKSNASTLSLIKMCVYIIIDMMDSYYFLCNIFLSQVLTEPFNYKHNQNNLRDIKSDLFGRKEK